MIQDFKGEKIFSYKGLKRGDEIPNPKTKLGRPNTNHYDEHIDYFTNMKKVEGWLDSLREAKIKYSPNEVVVCVSGNYYVYSDLFPEPKEHKINGEVYV